MLFINPIEILQLEHVDDPTRIDPETIKKEKRRLFVEIELSDSGLYQYNGKDITKSDCERVINELDNEERREFYYYLITNPSLNTFLTTGNEKIFNSFNQESIYKLPAFIDFINPFFSERFDKALLKAFKANDTTVLKSVLRTILLVNQSNINNAFKSVSNEIKDRIDGISKLREEIKSKKKQCDENSIREVVKIVKTDFPIEVINILPSYFQSQINKIGDEINFLDLAIDKEIGISLSSIYLMEHLLKLNIESVSKKTFERNFEVTKRSYDGKIEQEKNAPILKQWASVLGQIQDAIKEVDDKTKKPNSFIVKIKSIVNISELNKLPNFANEIRNQIGYAVRSLAISSWNVQNDIDTAIMLISHALKIEASEDAKAKFGSDFKDLVEIKKQREKKGKPINSAPVLGTIYGIGFTIYGDTLYFVFLAIPIIPLSRYNCANTYTGYTFYGLLKLHKWQKIWQLSVLAGILLWIIVAVVQSNSSPSYPTTESSYTQPSNSYTPPATSNNSVDNSAASSLNAPVYKPATMKNGNIPNCSGFKPQYDYNINNKLIISAEVTDAAVKIFDYETDKCIRFVFIMDGTTYSVKNIPEGKYYLKIAYGNDWSVREGDPLCQGRFASHASYKKDADLYDFNKKYYDDGRVSIPYYTLKLYTTYSLGNNDNSLSPNGITENEFFNN